jgi:hypothetical protein
METKTTASQTSGHRGPRPARLRVTVIVVLWLAAVLGGSAAMLRYEFSAGGAPAAPAQWPAASRIPRVAGHPTLVVFAHPLCPCTSATFDELTEIMAKAGVGTTASVLFFTRPDAGADWTQASSVRQAAAIPGVTIIADNSAREARLFHAVTSGRALLYDPNGELIFDGGITGSRGHAGENAGANSLSMLLTRESAARATTPVFGCSILQRSTSPRSTPCTR